jgi:hypothetical protein
VQTIEEAQTKLMSTRSAKRPSFAKTGPTANFNRAFSKGRFTSKFESGFDQPNRSRTHRTLQSHMYAAAGGLQPSSPQFYVPRAESNGMPSVQASGTE